jgi:methionine synthase II (cobalamin-independent)
MAGESAFRVDPPFRADHVGSLLRPRKLLEARKARAEGKVAHLVSAASEIWR